MGVEWLAGGAAVAGIAVIMGCHDAWRGLRLKRAQVLSGRQLKRNA